jgi:hypothetical protein
MQRVNDMALEGKLVTVKEGPYELGIREATVCRILKDLKIKLILN